MRDNPEVVTGMREPHHTGQVSKPFSEPTQLETIRRQALNEGEVEFHSLARAYRVEFAKPKQQMDPISGEIIQEGPRFLQFKGRRCVTSDPTLIHSAKGCENIKGAMVFHDHTAMCNTKTCQVMKCSLGHQNPKNPTQRYFPRHPSFGIKMDFWDAADMDAMVAKSAKASAIANFKTLAQSIPAEDLPRLLEAAGIDSFQLPKREVPKEATK